MATLHNTQTGINWIPPTSPRKLQSERLNQITHGFGCLLAVIASISLLRHLVAHGDTRAITGAVIYCFGLIAVFAASTLSHSFWAPGPRHFFRTLDQVAIFLLIAGSYTPVSLMHFRDGWLPAIMWTMWFCAIGGIVAKLCFRQLKNVSVGFYFMTGCLPLLSIHAMYVRMPPGGFSLSMLGGICFAVGVWFLVNDDKRFYYHAIWHLLVIAGCAAHFAAITRCLVA